MNFNKEMCFHITCLEMHRLEGNLLSHCWGGRGWRALLQPSSLNFNLGANATFVRSVQISLENIRIYFEYSSNHINHETAIR